MLFKDTTKIKEYAQFSAIDFNALKPVIAQVEDKHIETILGAEYTALEAAYTAAIDEKTLTADQKKLLHKCRQVIGPYLCYYYTPLVDVSLSDSGARRQETANVKTAYQYQLKNFMEANLKLAEEASESLLYFLEQNKATYTAWAASDQYKEYKSLFIRTGTDFNKIFPTSTPYSIYWFCRAKMYDIEENEIQKLLGPVLYTVIKTKYNEGTLTDNETILVGKLKKAIANMAIAFNMPFLNMTIGKNGLSVITQAPRASDDNISARSNADGNSISHAQRSALATGRQWIENVVAFLKSYPAEFPDFPGNVITVVPPVERDSTTSFALV